MTELGLAWVTRPKLINRWRGSVMKAIGLTVARPVGSDSYVAMTLHSLRHCDATRIAASLLNCFCLSLQNFVLFRASDDAIDS